MLPRGVNRLKAIGCIVYLQLVHGKCKSSRRVPEVCEPLRGVYMLISHHRQWGCEPLSYGWRGVLADPHFRAAAGLPPLRTMCTDFPQCIPLFRVRGRGYVSKTLRHSLRLPAHPPFYNSIGGSSCCSSYMLTHGPNIHWSLPPYRICPL